MIDPHRLLLLREVAKASSFAGAAAALRQTPSAVSQQIAALERGVGTMVVNRTTRGITLTPAGQVLLAAADSIHAELRAAGRGLDELREYGPRSLTVVTFPSAGEPLLAPALSSFAALPLPGGRPVDITVVEAEPADAVATVRSGDADLALVYHFRTPKPSPDWTRAGETYIPLIEDEFVLLVRPDHPVAGRASVPLSEVAGERWINGWGDAGSILESLAAADGFQLDIACRSSDYRFMAAMVGAGVGVALAPELTLTAGNSVTSVRLDPPQSRYLGVYLPRGTRHNRYTETLIAALREQVRRGTPAGPRQQRAR